MWVFLPLALFLYRLFSVPLGLPFCKLPLSFLALEKRLYLREQDTGQGLRFMDIGPARMGRPWGSALGHMADAGRGDLGREAHGHSPAVFDAHAVPNGKAVCLRRMDEHFLGSAEIADQQVAAVDAADARFHGF